jgi:ferric-dicitrate binding protein FerR (iron transport regulator)
VTPDALVVVHGTRFAVEVQPDEDGAPHTCVRVTEGKVAVHGKTPEPVFLLPGEQFGCSTTVADLPLEESEASEPAEAAVDAPTDLPQSASNKRSRPSVDRRRPVAPAGLHPSAGQGTLAKETALLQAAVGAEQRGDTATARSKLNELLGKYPKSPLREDARLMLRRLSARQP